MNKPYTIENAIQEVADALDGGQDRSVTTIRCALNDALDAAASKNGRDVADDETGFGYDQEDAVQAVREIIGKGAR